ncbi:hypothetical protein [Leifsonia sp. fls2-241-R2A-40a]|uniref:hypothetical protein n=1 Tax=Leifsonia sp. fls2-241-R2A-40a TaxID=3040290 RepID=UPI00254C600F|nr:hypothetical protein [Leifsonia sp. fls2-241-R2A-40a]
MASYLVNIAGRRFVADEDDIDRVREQILSAVRSGGGFITLTSAGAQIEVLVRPGAPVSIEKRPEPEQDEELTAAGASTMESVGPPTDEFDEWGI